MAACALISSLHDSLWKLNYTVKLLKNYSLKVLHHNSRKKHSTEKYQHKANSPK